MIFKIVVGIWLGCLILICSSFIFLVIVSKWNKRVRLWCCNNMDWHNNNKEVLDINAINLVGKCSTCGKRILMDSNGNWFEAEWQEKTSMSDNLKLRSCPFCGRDDVKFEQVFDPKEERYFYRVACSHCDARDIKTLKEEES